MTDHRISPRQTGVTLIELMVAMVLGLLVAGGIVSIFISTSSSSKVQTQLARLQEEGRFAITRLSGDLRMANGQYCTNSGGVAKAQSNGTYLDGLRAPTVYAKNLNSAIADLSTPMGTGVYPADPKQKYAFPSFMSMRGYDCGKTACTPADPNTAITGTTIPVMGTAFDDRVVGASVLTVRYVNPARGWVVGNTASTTSINATGNALTDITIRPNTAIGEPPATDFKTGDLAMLADCSNAQIFAASNASGVITPTAASNHGAPTPQTPSSAPKLFDFNRDFQTVTYYLKVVSVNNNGVAPFTGALMRRVNGDNPAKSPAHGGSEDELVRGIERLNFKYGVEDADGNTSFLTAAEVDASTACPPAAPSALSTSADPGCLWRAVKSIEVDILMDGQIPLYTLAPNELQYAYTSDKTTAALAAPDAHAIKPSDQGFVDPLLRREFTALVSVRNFNP
ncbi:MAG: PilW family protein [Rhodanobacter sp.]